MTKNILFLLIPFLAFSQSKIKVSEVLKKDLTTKMNIKGNFIKALQWKDNLGENIIAISETGIYSNENENSNAEIFAYHFLNQNKEPNWKIYDFEKDCPVDVEAFFVKDAIEITDLDNDNIAEIWLIYKISCRGDISPRKLKIIMYTSNKKFALRGEERVITKTESFGGKYSFDDNFKTAAKIFRDFALKKWKENYQVKLN